MKIKYEETMDKFKKVKVDGHAPEEENTSEVNEEKKQMTEGGESSGGISVSGDQLKECGVPQGVELMNQSGAKGESTQAGPSTFPRKKQIRKINSRYSTHIKRKCNEWAIKTAPTEPSFCFLYWRSIRGHQEIIWEGPEYMRSFAENAKVLEVFKNTALSRAFIPKDATHPLLGRTPDVRSVHPICLRSRNPCDYRNDVLAKIIPRILNPLGKRSNFYDNSLNCPAWFPKDKVQFRRPNHPRSGEKRMKAEEMRIILQSFLDNCSNCYKIACEEDMMPKEENGSEYLSRTNLDEDGCKAAMITVQTRMTSEQALRWCSDTDSWSEFGTRVMEAAEKVDLSILSNLHISTTCIEENIDWRRKKVLENVLPEEFIPCISSAEGDCLFCAVSLLLFGSEDHHKDLRFAAVHHAILHFNHYLKMLTTEIKSIDDARQFFATVTSSDEDPSNEDTVSNILEFTLQMEIRSTAKIGCYSGLLQILFLSGVTQYAIQQHCEIQRDGYDTTLYPCACNNSILGTIHIMWVKFEPTSATLNHIIPLFKRKTEEDSIPTFEDESNSEFVTKSLKYGLCLFCAHSGTIQELSDDMSMVQCDTCSTWFHCACIGVGVDHFDNGKSFHCCIPLSPENNFQVVISQRGRKRAALNLSDVQSLYPRKGVSDAVIDFFVRILLPKAAATMTTSALAYTAIVCASRQRPCDLKTTFLNTNGPLDVHQPLLLFPCCIQEAWHWILVAVYQLKEIAFVMDSLSPSVLLPYSNQAVENINSLLKCWDPELTLKAVAYQVPLQQGAVDCGAHVMKHIQTVTQMQNPAETLLGNANMLKAPVDTKGLRKYILAQCSDCSRALARRSRQKLMVRHSEAEKKKHQLANIENMLLKKDVSGLKSGNIQVVDIPQKGRGVVTTREYKEGEFVCEYEGELLPYKDTHKRELTYLKQSGESYIGYMYYFTFKGEKYCIDATEDKGQIGRMMNHSKKALNVTPHLVDIQGWPRVCFFTKMAIATGEEILYDYGDSSSSARKAHPWLEQ